ncbi:MAG TPA: dihydrolipoamide acetyltransferase family protein [Burkholderiaceae bacterium]|nr:dihydrolipoamide acetyltransferase family protein [Burkholderiaceae bacterium]
MAVYTIKMPDIGEGIAEVELVEWHVREGDTVVEDQVLADVMTEKATVQVPSPVNGKVLALGGKVGEVMAVGSDLVRLEIDGATPAASPEDENSLEAEGKPELAESGQPGTESVQGRQAIEPAENSRGTQRTEGRQGSESVQDRQGARPSHDSVGASSPSAPGIGAEPGRGLQNHAVQSAPQRRASGSRPLASPAVRRRALQEGVDLRLVPATGPVGQVIHDDLERWLQHRGAAPAHAAGGGSGSVSARLNRREGVEEIPVVGLRRKIAQKMQASKRHIPHFTYVEEVDVTELEALRSKLNERWAEERGKLTLLPFLARSIVLAVREFPQMNARYDDEQGVVQRYAPVHLGMATQTENGLMVPVMRHAEAHDLWSFAAEVKRLAEAARAGTAQRDELSGSTITLTSLGALGGIVSTPVINHPEVAIVGVNRVVERPVVVSGAVVVRKMMNLSSSFDHRVVDGMHAAQFIQCIRGYLECPSLLFVE